MDTTPNPYPLDERTARDLWTDLRIAVGMSEILDEALTVLAVRIGLLVECPLCDNVVEPDEQVGPCEMCALDE